MTGAILLIDADLETLRSLGGHLEAAGFEVARELNGAAALGTLDRLEPDVAVVDLGLPPVNGESLLSLLRRRGVAVIGVLGEANPSWAAAAVRDGADWVLYRPTDPELLTAAVERAAGSARLRRVAGTLAAGVNGGSLEQLGSQPPMRAVAQRVVDLAQSDRSAVLVTGEAGTGKGWVARLIHDLSPRRSEPFLPVLTAGAGWPELETLIFGHEQGAHRGAGRRQRGLLEIAGEGTLLIREVGLLPLELQPMLLRVLEHRVIRRAGGERDVPVAARILATTSQDLAAAVEAGRFREDLHYRLNTVVLLVPPVRERSEADRRALIESAHQRLSERLAAPLPPIAPEAMERLLQHPWPGNVGEIRHVLERAGLLARAHAAIQVEHLPGEFRARPGLGDRRHNPMSLEETERRQIESSLRFHGGNRTRAAKELRISRATLINKIKRYGITE
jgi:DNA-binding NtrC family response regulator